MSNDVEYEMTIDNPTLPKGAEIQILGLGVFENGSTYQVSKDEADGFRNYHARQVDVTDDNGTVTGTERQIGQTLLQASKTMYGVEVDTPDNNKSRKTHESNRSNTPTASQQPAKAEEAEKATESSGGDE